MIEFWDYLSQFLAVAAGFCAALRAYLKSRRQPWFLLTCFYGTFALGTLYWTLHLLLRQETGFLRLRPCVAGQLCLFARPDADAA